MKEMLKKLMEKKGKSSEMSKEYKDAKGGMLKNLMKDMSGMMAEPVKSLKKVSVVGNSDDAVKMGLQKAESELEAKHNGPDEDKLEESNEPAETEQHDPEAEHMSPEQQALEGEGGEDDDSLDGMADEDLDAMIKHMTELKQKRKMK